MRLRIQAWAVTLLLALVLAGVGPTARAQQATVQYVDSLEAYQRTIEGLVGERLSSLLNSGDYIVRASVSGTRERVRSGAAPGPNLDLPGFRPSGSEPTAGEARFRVEQVVVRIVLNKQLPAADLQYIRTIVPILADFRADRGDRLDLQVTAGEPGQAAGFGAPGGALGDDMPFGLSWQEWLLVGVLVLLLLVLLVLMWRLAAPRRVEPPAAVPAPPAPAPRPEPAVDPAEQRRAEQERQLSELRHSVIKRLFGRPELGRELLGEWSGSPNKMADLAAALGPTIARQAMLPQLGREEYLALEEKTHSAQAPDASRQLNTLREAHLWLLAQEVMRPELLRPNPFRFLDSLTWGQIAHLIKDEPVKVKAIVLSRLKPEDTARILEALPKELQLEIAVTLGNLQDLPLEMAESVATDLAQKARYVPDPRLVEIEGPSALVDLMGRTSSATSRYLLEAMKSKDTRLSLEVEKRFFMFEAIPLVPEDIMPQAVRTLPSGIVVQAMQGASPELQRKVIMAFPEQARTGLVTALRASRAEPDAVAEARRQVVAKFQELGRQGRIDLKQISAAWQAQAKAS
jgi:flagellar motor switch protein FliG